MTLSYGPQALLHANRGAPPLAKTLGLPAVVLHFSQKMLILPVQSPILKGQLAPELY